MGLKCLIRNNDAVVGIVTTVMLIGLLVTVLAIVNTLYVPNWIEEEEAKHMEAVSNQFANLKFALDIQSLVDDPTSISTSITLARNEIPIFDTQRSAGELNILSNSSSMDIKGNTSINSKFINSSAIIYSSKNTYFVNQNYVYEMGTFILSQEDSNVVIGKPSIFIVEPRYMYDINISITVVNISGVGSKNFAAGFGTYPIYTQVVNNSNPIIIENCSNITIYTTYTNTWYTVFNETLRYYGSKDTDYEIDESNNMVKVEFISPILKYNVFVKEVKIAAQIAWGLVE